MRRQALYLLSLSLILSGCHERQGQEIGFVQTPILNRPITAIAPIINNLRTDLNWNVSEELSQAVNHRISQKNNLYLMSREAVASMTQKALASHDPFGTDISWVKKAFPQNEFVVFMELLDHRETAVYGAKETTQEAPAELLLSVRVRIVDLRKETPNIVLQEIVQQSHYVPCQFTRANFSQVPWGDETFEISPLGIAHDKLCKELASRIEDYILTTGD